MNPVSDASAAAFQKNMETWRPSEVHPVVPTLVLACGALTDEDYQSIKIHVEERISLGLPPGLVYWQRMETKESVTEEATAQLIVRFLSLDYVEELQAHGFLLDLPNRERPLDLQIIVVHKRDDKDGTVSSSFLQALGDNIKQVIGNSTTLRLVLVAIGEGPLDLGKETPFWPRFRLQAITSGWTIATSTRVLEECQNLIVSLITSELIGGIEYALEEEKLEIRSIACFWIGASALVADIAGMQDYVRLKVLQGLIHPIVSTGLTTLDRRNIEINIEGKVGEVQSLILSAASQIEKFRKHWKINLRKDEKGKDTAEIVDTPQERGIALNSSTKLSEKILKPVKNLATELREHYILLRDTLFQELKDVVRKQYESLEHRLEFFINPVRRSDEVWPLQELPPSGLAALAHAVEVAADCLYKSSDVVYAGLSYHRIGKDGYLNAVAVEDAQMVFGTHRRFRRNERTILSRWGFLFKMIPAWALLTGIITGFTQWTELCAAIVAFLFLAILATAEYALAQYSLYELWSRLMDGIIREIGNTVLRLLAKILRDYRLFMVGRLQELGAVLKDLVTLLEKVDLECQLRLADIGTKFSALEEERASIYWLADREVCDRWANDATRAAEGLGGRSVIEDLVARIIFAYMFERHPSLSCYQIYDKIETIAQQAVTALSNARLEFNIEQEKEHKSTPVEGLGLVGQSGERRELKLKRTTALDALWRLIRDEKVYVTDQQRKPKQVTGKEPLAFLNYNQLDICVLDEREEPLARGKRWQWLYSRGQPLGGGANTKSLTFIMTEDDAIWAVTAFGKNSPYWRPDAKVVRSRLKNEVGCVRALVEFRQAE